MTTTDFPAINPASELLRLPDLFVKLGAVKAFVADLHAFKERAIGLEHHQVASMCSGLDEVEQGLQELGANYLEKITGQQS